MSACEPEDENPTGGREEREEEEQGDLAEADGGEEAQDTEHEANESCEALAQSRTVRRPFERRTRGYDEGCSGEVHGVSVNEVRSDSGASVSPPTGAILSRRRKTSFDQPTRLARRHLIDSARAL
jgi:hypothetical protein